MSQPFDFRERINARLDGPPVHRRIGPTPTPLTDFAAGAAAGFLVGISPFLAMLALMVFGS